MKWMSALQIAFLEIRFRQIRISPPSPSIIRETVKVWKDKLIRGYRRRGTRTVSIQGDMPTNVFLWLCWEVGRAIHKKKYP
jgi:hypothetical protein